MEELVTYMTRSIVSNPDAVVVGEGERRGEPTLQITVDEADRGVVIGREGRTIRAMEVILRVAHVDGQPPGLEVGD
jgi:hypothetical protein